MKTPDAQEEGQVPRLREEGKENSLDEVKWRGWGGQGHGEIKRHWRER